MARATSCELNGHTIDVDQALELKEQAQTSSQPQPDFRCGECHDPVRPHNARTQGAAHFEHHERNPSCSRSDPAR